MENITPEYLDQIRDNSRIRRRLAFEHPLWFSMLYLRQHFTHPLAPFHLEMFHLVNEPRYQFVVVMAFRESGKSTILNMTNVLWSILGKPGKKFVIIMSNTQEQAKNHFANIKHELETNTLLREDFGPFTENAKDWNNKLSLELEYHGSKILCVIRDQAIRGLKYNQYRPDLIICDDLEDSSSVKDRTSSAAFVEQFESEVLPLGNENTKIVILGNLIKHYYGEDEVYPSFIVQMRSNILYGKSKGVFRAYPLIDDRGVNLWPGRFPDHDSVLKLRNKLPLSTWILEFLLKSFGQNNAEGPNIQFGDNYDLQGWRKYMEPNGAIFNGYGIDRMRQKALIPQMEEYDIRAPAHSMALFDSRNDPKYRKYLDDMYFYPETEDFEQRMAKDMTRYHPYNVK